MMPDVLAPAVLDQLLRGAARQNLRSTTAVATCGGRFVSLKTSDTNLEREAATLRDLQDCRTADARVVPFLAYDAGRNVLATEYVHGDSLFNVLWNGTSRWRVQARHTHRCDRLVVAAAGWLSAFRRCGPQCHDRTKDSAAVLAWLTSTATKRLDIVGRSESKIVSTADLLRLRLWTQRMAEHLERATFGCRIIHGDYCASNILVDSESTVVVLDFADSRVGLDLEDTVRLWCSVWEIAMCGRRRHTLLAASLNAIAHSGAESPAQCGMFDFLRAWNGITKLYQHATVAGRVAWGTRSILKRQARAHRAWLLEVCA